MIKATNDLKKLHNGVFDRKIEMTIEKHILKEVHISFRPYLIEMLRTLKKNFELVLFTAGFRTYAKAIVQEI